MRCGDFSLLAEHYVHRAGYSRSLLKTILHSTTFDPSQSQVADVGAGTGKLTQDLLALGMKGFAIEPNLEMRKKGQLILRHSSFTWLEGRAEDTHLEDNSVEWVFMGSAFHWTETQEALREFHRILKPGGHFVALWNPRDIAASPIEQAVEEIIRKTIPNLDRLSSGYSSFTENLPNILVTGGFFEFLNCFESPHQRTISRDSYLETWKSVNDVRVQAGEEKFQEILQQIDRVLGSAKFVTTPYKTRAWVVQSKKRYAGL